MSGTGAAALSSRYENAVFIEGVGECQWLTWAVVVEFVAFTPFRYLQPHARR